jgi:hypothetical protein
MFKAVLSSGFQLRDCFASLAMTIQRRLAVTLPFVIASPSTDGRGNLPGKIPLSLDGRDFVVA